MPRQKRMRILLPILALTAMIAAAACGTVATPEWAAEAQATRVALAATDEHLTAIAPTFTPSPAPTETPVPPTPTPIPPTATTVPPTETPLPPTEVPTTAAATEESAGTADLAAAVAAADPANGQVIFTTQHDNADRQPGNCSICHSVTPDEMRVIGPGLWNVSVRAASRVPGEDALTYIHESIVNPDGFITPGDPPYPPGLMPQNWHEILTEQELNDVIAYLMTLHD